MAQHRQLTASPKPDHSPSLSNTALLILNIPSLVQFLGNNLWQKSQKLASYKAITTLSCNKKVSYLWVGAGAGKARVNISDLQPCNSFDTLLFCALIEGGGRCEPASGLCHLQTDGFQVLRHHFGEKCLQQQAFLYKKRKKKTFPCHIISQRTHSIQGNVSAGYSEVTQAGAEGRKVTVVRKGEASRR